jgi:hypothetical protein
MKFCAFLLGFIACVGGCSAKQPSDPYATVLDFCEAWGKTACNVTVVKNCAGVTAATTALTDACVEKQQTFCEGLVPTSGYSSAQAQTCLDAVHAAYADATLTGAEITTVRHLGDPCDHLIKGPAAEGASCTQDSDCDTTKNVQCVMKGGVGTCVIPMVVANGTSCAAPSASCMPGFYCGTGNFCVQSVAVGGDCASDSACATGLICKGIEADAGTTTGKCAAPGNATGCTTDSDCTPMACETATGKCVASIILSPAEALCGDLQ